MSSTIRVNYPAGIKSVISADPTQTPMIENQALGERQIGTLLAAETINSTDSVMPPTHVIAGTLTATGTINLRAGVDPTTGDADVDGNTKRLLSIELWNLASSTNSIVIAPGAADPYPFLGAGNDIELKPGQSLSLSSRKNAGAAPADRPVAVSNTVKNIDVTISGTSSLRYKIVLGD
jgi:hypothetical protein